MRCTGVAAAGVDALPLAGRCGSGFVSPTCISSASCSVLSPRKGERGAARGGEGDRLICAIAVGPSSLGSALGPANSPMPNLFAHISIKANLLSLFPPAFDASSRLLLVYCLHAPLRVTETALPLAASPASILRLAAPATGCMLEILRHRQADDFGIATTLLDRLAS